MAAFLALRFVGGAASAFVLVFGSALVLDALSGAGRSRLAALHFAGVGIGIVLSALLVDTAEVLGFGWRAMWLASGAAAGLAVPFAIWLLPPVPVVVSEVSSSAAADDGRMQGIPALALCHGLFGFGYIVTATFLVAVVRAAPQAQLLEAVVWPLVGIAAAGSTLLWGWAGTRASALRLYGPTCLLLAVGVAAGGLWPTPAGVVLASLLLGGTFMGLTAFGFAAARVLAPTRQGRAFAVITSAFGLGQIVGPILAGWLLDRTGTFASASLIAAAGLVVAAVIASGAAKRFSGFR